MRKPFPILLLVVLIALVPKMAQCQDSILQKMALGQDSIKQMELEANLANLQQDIDLLSEAVNTYDDIELYDYELQEVGNRIKAFSVMVNKDNPQYDAYDQCNRDFYQMQKRIDALKEEHDHTEGYEAIMGVFQNTLTQLSSYKELGEKYVENGQSDSLTIVKKKAGKVYQKAMVEATTQKDLVNNDETLSQLWNSIEDDNVAIDSLECKAKNNIYDLIFRVVMVVAVLLLVINMIHSKIKAAKMAKTAVKQMEDAIGANDDPVL